MVAVSTGKPIAVIEALAGLIPQTSEAAMGTSLTSAAEVVDALAATKWKLFESIHGLQDERADAATAVLGRVREALRSDEHVTALGPVLEMEQSRAIDLLAPAPATTPPKPRVDPPVKPPVRQGKKVIDSGSRDNLSLEEAESEIVQVREKSRGTKVAWINMSWIIEE